eukprot:scaffold133469_cov103-Phaeocystis_antarctica.AAC.1
MLTVRLCLLRSSNARIVDLSLIGVTFAQARWLGVMSRRMLQLSLVVQMRPPSLKEKLPPFSEAHRVSAGAGGATRTDRCSTLTTSSTLTSTLTTSSPPPSPSSSPPPSSPPSPSPPIGLSIDGRTRSNRRGRPIDPKSKRQRDLAARQQEAEAKAETERKLSQMTPAELEAYHREQHDLEVKRATVLLSEERLRSEFQKRLRHLRSVELRKYVPLERREE